MWVVRWLLGAITILVILLFALQNGESQISVTFFKWTTPQLPLYLYLFIAFGIGMLFWTFVSMGNIFKLKGDIHKLQKKNKKYRDELDRLRNLNVEEDLPEPQQPDIQAIPSGEEPSAS